MENRRPISPADSRQLAYGAMSQADYHVRQALRQLVDHPNQVTSRALQHRDQANFYVSLAQALYPPLHTKSN